MVAKPWRKAKQITMWASGDHATSSKLVLALSNTTQKRLSKQLRTANYIATPKASTELAQKPADPPIQPNGLCMDGGRAHGAGMVEWTATALPQHLTILQQKTKAR